MSQRADDVASQPIAVQRQRNWVGIITSSLVGGVVAVVAAPTIFALLPGTVVGLTIASATSGILGSSTTRILGNSIHASRVALIVHRNPVQQFYRRTVVSYIGTTLASVISNMRTNTNYTCRNRVFFDVGGSFSLQGMQASERRRMFFDFSFKVVPQDGARRPLEEGVCPPDLPEYEEDRSRMIITGDNKDLLDGITSAILQGAAFGFAGGAIGGMFPGLARPGIITTVREIGVIVGIPSATGIAGPVMNLAFPSNEPDRAALFIEFVTEVQCHVNRLVRCAADNNVGLDLSMKIGATSEMEANVAEATAKGSESCALYWETERKVNLL